MNDFSIRTAWPEDLAAVARIYAHYVTTSVTTFEQTPPEPTEWHRRYWHRAERGLPFLVAEADEGVIGFGYCSPWRPRPAYRHTAEDSLYLAPQATGRGAGRALLNALLAECAAAGIRQVIAVIVDDTSADCPGASVALHRRCGFVPVGRLSRVGHKHGRWLDTVLMQRELSGKFPVWN